MPDDKQSKPLAQAFNLVSPKQMFPAAKALDAALAGNTGQFTMLGDTDHGNDQLPWFLARHDTLQAMQNNNVKTLFLEMPPMAQDLADKVAAGKMTPQEFERAYSERTALDRKASPYPNDGTILRGEIIRNAAAHGIKVVFADVKSGMDIQAEQERRARGVKPDMTQKVEGGAMVVSWQQAEDKRTVTGKIGMSAQEHLYRWTGGLLFPSYPQQLVKDGLAAYAEPSGEMLAKVKGDKKWMEERVGGDALLEQVVREKAGKDKAVIFYGAEHGREGCGDIAHRLGAQRIDIYSDTTGVKANAEMIHTQNGEFPDAAITIDKGNSFSRDDLKSLVIPGSPQLPKNLAPGHCRR